MKQNSYISSFNFNEHKSIKFENLKKRSQKNLKKLNLSNNN